MKLVSKIKSEYADIVIILTISFLRLLFFIPKLLTNEQLNSNVIGFGINLELVLWFLAVKAQTILLLLIWYLTSNHWWKISIMIPLTIELFKLMSFLNIKIESFDEIDFITSIPITIPIVFTIIFLSSKVNQFINSQFTYDELNNEIDNVFEEISTNSENERNLILEFEYLKKGKNDYSKADYLEKLIALRKQFY